MFELEEYSTGFHDGFLNKYADSSGPTLDFYISDSLQDMLDIDIRSEVANVVGSVSDYDNCMVDLPSSLEHCTDSLSLLNNSNVVKEGGHTNSSSWNSTSAFGLGSSNSSSSWFGANNDFLADVGACVNPISVMPLISSSLIHMSPKTNLNANIVRSNSPPPPSPNVNDTKSHLTFSPAHIKISANSIRNEQITSHIPKQIVPISSSVTSATSAPATLATNSALQRKNAAVDAIRKDLGPDLKKVIPISSANENLVFKTNPVAFGSSPVNNHNASKSTISTFSGNSSVHQSGNISSNNNSSSTSHSNNNNNSSFFNGGSASSSTIKLGPGIGGLTFANNITYNKLKQQSITKTSTAATITSNGTIVLKRDRDSSPMQNLNSLNNSTNSSGQHVAKILSRSAVQTSSSFTPKSIASSAHHNSHVHQQQQQQQQQNTSMINSINLSSNGNASNSSVSVTNTIHSGLGSGGIFASSGGVSSASTNIIAVKPLQQKIKSTPIESEFPKPAYSYSCLIAMALKNSRRGSLPVSEIYSFMCEHFPYFKTAPSGWKNSVRHNLSLNKCFEKIEKPPTNGNQRKGCLWAMNPERIAKMDEEVQKWSRKDPMAIRNAMVCPDNLEALERGEMKHGSSGDSDTEMDSQSEIEEASDMEEQELDETLVDNMLVEEDIDDDIHSAASHIDDDNDDNDVCEVVNKNTLHSTTNSSSPLTIASTKVKLNNLPATCNTNSSIHRDFDIEVEDIYDAIDIDDDKEAVRMAISQSDIIELSPADYNISGESHQSPKRARLNVNYSLGPSGEIENQFQNQQQLQIQSIKKIVKVQSVHDLQQIQQQLQQHHQQQQQQQMIVHSIATNNSVNSQHQQLPQQGNGQFAQIGSIPSTINDNLNRRKMQLVNRIS